MKKLLESKRFYFICGMVVTVFLLVPFWILGEDSIITYHDQLDGEFITYLLNAKYLFEGRTTYPELMNGISVNGLVSPAPGLILLFRFFSPFVAFMIGMVFVKLTAFCSMFLLLCEITERKWLACGVAICFMALPFYVVYGLCIPGQPLLILSLLKLQKCDWKSSVIWYLCIAWYGLFSSLALVGFACILLIGIWIMAALVQKKWLYSGKLICAAAVLTITYCCTNLSLVCQTLSGNGDISHRSEMQMQPVAFLDTFRNLLLEGDAYTGAKQKYMLPLIALAVIVLVVYWFKRKKVVNTLFVYALCVNLGILLLLSFYREAWVAGLRNRSTGIFHDLDLGRIGWLAAVHWYILAVTAADMILDAGKSFGRLWKYAGYLFVCASFSLVFLFAFLSSDLKSNVAKLIKGDDYYMMTYKQFFAEDLMEQANQLIGRPQEEYRVVSLGIYPAAAAYNGFYCLDAYSNHYSLEYKHEFRKVIEKELDKSEYLTNWYDNWGNRCYIVLAESNNYFTFEKRWSPVSTDVDIDTAQLKRMGCEYIISASYIMTPDELGLKLLNEEPFLTEESWYRIWVYQIEK